MNLKEFFHTKRGKIYLGDSLDLMRGDIADASVDLIMTSPPFGLVRKKSYGNVDADQYVNWFRPFGAEFRRILKPSGSLVIDIGGAWIPGQPTRSLYHIELLLMLCKEIGFNLAQEFFWWSPSKLPTPAEWVTVRRVRVKDAVDYIWWLSPTPWPKASNRRVLAPYSDAMKSLLKNGYKAKLRPSGHDISEKFSIDNKASIPPNLIAIPNTESNSYYLRYCTEHGLPQHPARFPSALPEYFIRMLTDVGDIVIDPFAGSCVTGEVAERLRRQWICCELIEDYLKGALGRFQGAEPLLPEPSKAKGIHYKLAHPATLWNGMDDEPLAADGGKSRKKADAVVYPTKEGPELVGAVREGSKQLNHGRAAKNAKKRNHAHTGS
ncbi:MAG: site-specific DNA-methyltransferase [Verrucomicrobia bacterium]|nr:site-specific DNA-methyltransferase [Verrucomicrobiota bacterium]